MANFPVHHGITLAANAYIENLNVEILSSDPIPVSAGRIWFNSTTKTFKHSTLDGSGGVIIRTYATKEALDAAVSTLTSDLAAEVTRAEAAEGVLTTDLAAEVTRATAAEGVLTAAVATEANTRASAVTTLTNNLAAEVTRATNAEGVLTTDLAAEVTRATNAEGVLTTDLAAEVTRATDAEGVLTTDLAAEVTARTDGDAAINTKVGELADLTTSVKTSIVNAINNIKSSVGALGNAFNYVGTIDGGVDAASAYDMSTLASSQKNAGDYFKVSTAGYFKIGAGAAFYANLNDGLVWNTASGVDKIDNTDSVVVSGDEAFISVTGSVDTGFEVDVGATFKGRVDTLETDLADEIARAEAAEGVLQDNINTEATTRASADTTLTTNLAAEVTRATAAEGVLTTAVATEKTRAEAAEATLTTNLASEVTRATAAEGVLTTNLAAEVTRATAAEGVLTTAVATEKTRAETAEGVLQDNIDAEATTRANAVTSLTSAIAAEETRATTAEGVLDSAIGSLGSLTTTVKTSAVAAINELYALVDGGTADVRNDYNATVWTYEATTAATTHTLTHNLNSGFVDFSVMIQRADGKFYNDIASIQVVDANSATLYLSSALKVKVIARSAVAL